MCYNLSQMELWQSVNYRLTPINLLFHGITQFWCLTSFGTFSFYIMLVHAFFYWLWCVFMSFVSILIGYVLFHRCHTPGGQGVNWSLKFSLIIMKILKPILLKFKFVLIFSSFWPRYSRSPSPCKSDDRSVSRSLSRSRSRWFTDLNSFNLE